MGALAVMSSRKVGALECCYHEIFILRLADVSCRCGYIWKNSSRYYESRKVYANLVLCRH